MNSTGISRGAVLAGAAAALAVPSTVRAQQTQHLKLAGVPEDSITPALYAEDAGLFRRAGITVEIAPERSGSAIASGIAGGAFDIAKSSLVGLIVARAKGIPFVLVAAGGVYSSTAPVVGLLVKADAPVKTAADLNGKTIAVSALGDIYSLSMSAWMEKNGGKPDSVKQLEFPVGAVPDALIAGRVDAGPVIEPILQAAVDAGKVRVIGHPFDAIAPRFLYTAWFAMTDWTAAHVPEALAFNHAMRDASVYSNAHKPESVDRLAKYTSIAPATIAKMTRVECGSVLDPKLIQPVIDACAKYKVIPAPFDARDMIAAPFRG